MESMEKIGIPMEEELSTLRGLDSMSTRCYTSAASVDLRFKQGTDMAVAYREVRDRILNGLECASTLVVINALVDPDLVVEIEAVAAA